MKTPIICLITALIAFSGPLALCPAAETDSSAPFAGIVLSTREVPNGNLLLLEIETRALQPPITDMRLTFQKSSYPMFAHPARSANHYFGLIGIPFQAAPGPATLVLHWSDTRGARKKELAFRIAAGKYETDVLTVDPTRVNPSKKDRERALREQREINRIYATPDPARLWEGLFQAPLESEITSPFGNRRVFNGQLQSYHNGVDFRAPVGTPVYAANRGTVRLAKNLFYSGNAVIIDHGTHVFTIYAHLGEIKTATGRQIEKGHLLGLSGSSGRVSGPHLHWGVKVNRVAVNPLQFSEVMALLLKSE